ncbi:MAG: sigma-70 family RNA polymerase sigma factor [Fuerstiella sp.]
MSSSPPQNFQQEFELRVKQLAREPQAALASMFDLAAMRLVRFATGITKSQDDAEDAVQSAFSRIAAKPKLLMKATYPWPYFIRTVRNEALRVLQKRRTTSLGEFDTQCGTDTAELLVQREETADWVQRILRSLPTNQSEVVILKHWEELTFAEIADVLGKSQNTVASRYRYAMEKLHRSLEPLVARESKKKEEEVNAT